MKKTALQKDFRREIKNSLGRFLSIFFIVAIGVAFFSGIRAAEPDMRYSGDVWLDQKNLMDIQVISTLGLTEEDIEALKDVEGIEAVEGGYSVDVLTTNGENQEVLHVMSLSSGMNQVVVTQGRLPEAEDECFMDVDYLDSSEYKVGDKIEFRSGTSDPLSDTLKEDTYTIVGAGYSPRYLSFYRGSSTVGSGVIDGFAIVPEKSFDLEVYTELDATVAGAREMTAFTEEYDTHVETVTERVEDIKEERQQARYNEVVSEAEEELNDARKELDDKKKEAQQELADAQKKIDDGRKQLEDGKREIADGQSEIDSAKEELQTQQENLDEQQAQVTAGFEELNANVETLNGQIEELNQVKQQYMQAYASGMVDQQTLQGMAAQIAEGDARIDEAKVQLDAARAELENGQVQINEGQEQINHAWAEIDTNQQKLNDAQTEVAENEQKLTDAQTEYDDAKKEADEKIADAEDKIADAEDEISKIEHAKWYINDRSVLSEYTGYGENADRMGAIGKVFPVLFFLVAALISLTTMTRMVEEQRTQIGTMKALGYSNGFIAAKYLGYAALATVTGAVFGVLIGEKLLPYIIITAYRIMYSHMDTVQVPYDLYYAGMAAGAALACTLGATWISCAKELRSQAAELMRPPAPKKGKRVFLERIPLIWRNLSFIWKATVRNLVRYKKRFFMTVFGIGGCMSLLLVGFGLRDSIFAVGELQYGKIQLYDANIILDTDESQADRDAVYQQVSEDERVKGAAEALLEQVDVNHGKTTKEVYLNVPKDEKDFTNYVVFEDRVTGEQYSLNNDGVILTEKMAKMLDVQVGDTVTIRDDVQGELETTVENICENYMGHYIYMTPGLYEKMYQKQPEYNAVYYTLKEFNRADVEEIGEKALSMEGALNVTYTADFQDQLDDMLSSLDIVLIVLVISAGMLAFVVLYNLNNINITERKRELATLKVLGFFDGEVASYVYRENIILTLAGALAGIFMGELLHRFVIVTVEIDNVMFGRNINPISFVYGTLITLGFSLFVNGVMYFKLRNIDMVESLKSIE